MISSHSKKLKEGLKYDIPKPKALINLNLYFNSPETQLLLLDMQEVDYVKDEVKIYTIYL